MFLESRKVKCLFCDKWLPVRDKDFKPSQTERTNHLCKQHVKLQDVGAAFMLHAIRKDHASTPKQGSPYRVPNTKAMNNWLC